ncbi:MAG: hypothetical protein U9M92_02340 [Patescibacteria group bacterium]|nr:hypothetical protein [Patescibacteria group bacterium]
MFLNILLGVLLFSASVIVLIGVLWVSALHKIHASFVAHGTIELVMAGETLFKVLANVPGYYYDPITKRMRKLAVGEEDPNEGKIASYLRRRWGFFWVSILYPMRQVHRFVLASPDKLESQGRQVETGVAAPGEVRKRLLAQPNRLTEFLLWQIPHPVLVRQVLLEGGTRVDFLLMVMLEVESPEQAILIHNAKFFSTLNSAVESALTDRARSWTYEQVIKQGKGPSADSTFRSMLRAIHDSATPPDGRSVKDVTGLRVVDMYVVDYGASPEDEDVAEAKRNVVIAALEKEAAEERAKGDQALFTKATEALIALGVDKDKAAKIVADRLRWDRVAASKVTTLVEAGAVNIGG